MTLKQNPSEQELQKTLRAVFDTVNQDESGVAVANTDRMTEFSLCCEALKAIFSGQDAVIKCTPHDHYASVGTISVTVPKMTIDVPELFAKVTGFASNYEIYPKLDGSIVLELIFYNLTTKVG